MCNTTVPTKQTRLTATSVMTMCVVHLCENKAPLELRVYFIIFE